MVKMTFLDKIIKSFAKHAYSVFEHVYEIGKNRNELIPLLTTLAAIIYTMSSTLGSGSYKDFLPVTGGIIEIAMLIIVFLSIILFSTCLLSYLDEVLDLTGESPEILVRFRMFKKNQIIPIFILAATPALLIMFYNLIFVGLDAEVSEYKLRWYFFYSALIALFIPFIAIFERLFFGKMGAFNFFNVVTNFCLMAVAMNVYSDAQKSSLNTNNQYCYWILNTYANENRINADERLCKDLGIHNEEMKFIINKVIKQIE